MATARGRIVNGLVACVALLAGLAAITGCGDGRPAGATPAPPSIPGGPAAPTAEASASAAPLRVVAINTPLACFAARIGGNAVVVTMPVPEGQDPAFWSPDAKEVTAMQAADLIVLNAAGHEPWLARTSLPERKLVPTAERFKSDWIESADGVTHSHGLSGQHTHKGTAFTTWIDPSLAEEQAIAIFEALAKARPDQRAAFEANLAKLKTDLADLDRTLEGAIHGQQSLPIVVSHPVYDYLLRRFALNATVVHWEPSELPSDAEWTAFEAMLAEHPARWMVWEDQPTQAVRDRLRALGVEVVVFNPGGNLGPGDPARWLELQRANAAELALVYQ